MSRRAQETLSLQEVGMLVLAVVVLFGLLNVGYEVFSRSFITESPDFQATVAAFSRFEDKMNVLAASPKPCDFEVSNDLSLGDGYRVVGFDARWNDALAVDKCQWPDGAIKRPRRCEGLACVCLYDGDVTDEKKAMQCFTLSGDVVFTAPRVGSSYSPFQGLERKDAPSWSRDEDGQASFFVLYGDCGSAFAWRSKTVYVERRMFELDGVPVARFFIAPDDEELRKRCGAVSGQVA